MGINMYIGTCVDMFVDTCIDMCVLLCKHAYGHVYRYVYRHMSGHVCRHVERHACRPSTGQPTFSSAHVRTRVYAHACPCTGMHTDASARVLLGMHTRYCMLAQTWRKRASPKSISHTHGHYLCAHGHRARGHPDAGVWWGKVRDLLGLVRRA